MTAGEAAVLEEMIRSLCRGAVCIFCVRPRGRIVGSSDTTTLLVFPPSARLTRQYNPGGAVSDIAAMMWATEEVDGHEEPLPIVTADFPPPGPDALSLIPAVDGCGGDCCVCLEPVAADAAARLPCVHGPSMHRACLWRVVNVGACDAMRCPLCRCTLDRYDLRSAGYAVEPSRLRSIAPRCQEWRSLMAMHVGRSRVLRAPNTETLPLAHRILRCALLTACDGFVYNTCLLALERCTLRKAWFARPFVRPRCAFFFRTWT